MNTLVEMLSPGFLLREALIGSVLVGCLCPLVGVYFVLRRMIFLGVALPQLSAAGIALAFLAVSHARWSAPALYAERALAGDARFIELHMRGTVGAGGAGPAS